MRATKLLRIDHVLLAAVAVLAHLQALRIGFLHDDLFHYLHAVMFDGVGAAIASFWLPSAGEEFYRPLVDTSFALTFAAFGAEALAFRACDVVLHAVTVVCAARLAASWIGVRGAGLTVGLLLAVHPLPGRALNWTSDRYVVAATLFTVLALHAYHHWRTRRAAGAGRRWFVAAIVAHVAALCSKESGAAVPVAILVADWFWGAGRDGAIGVRLKRVACGVFPFVAINVAYFAMRYVGFGDLGGYRDQESGGTLLPFGVGEIVTEACVDLPLKCIVPLNRLLTDGWIEAVLTAALVVPAAALLFAARAPRVRDAVGGIALGYALLLPSLPYFYIGRDLLKAYHIYPVAIGFALAAWAVVAQSRWRPRAFAAWVGALACVWIVVDHVNAQCWIRATRVVDAFAAWTRSLDPPLDETREVWIAGLPHNVLGALVIEPNKMRETLEVLHGRRLGPARGLGHGWSDASGADVARSVAAGGRLLHFDAVRGTGRETGVGRGAAPLRLVDGGRAATGAFGPVGDVEPGADGVLLRGRAGRFQWTGAPFEQSRYRGLVLQMRITPVDGARGPVSTNVRWTDEHYSPGGISRLVRIPTRADGAWHDYEVDLVRSGWVGESLYVDRLFVSPARTAVRAEVRSITFIPW